MKKHILVPFLIILLTWSCAEKSQKGFNEYMKKHHADDYLLTEYPAQNLIEKEATDAIINYLIETGDKPKEYYIYLLTYKGDNLLTINIEHISGYELMYYWISEKGREIPIVGNISGKGKTITWNIQGKEIISVGVVQ